MQITITERRRPAGRRLCRRLASFGGWWKNGPRWPALEAAEAGESGLRLSLGCTAVLLAAKLTAISLLVLAVGLSWETAYRVVVPVVATNTTGVFAVGLFIWLLMRLRA